MMIKVENIPEEDTTSSHSKGYNPNDILCRMCGYKSCMQQSEGRNLIREKLKQRKDGEDKDRHNPPDR